MKLKPTDLARFVRLTKEACYDHINKEEYRRLGRKLLKLIAEKMDLKKGEFDIRFNPGGEACSGDHTLHADYFYLALHDNIGSGWFYFRTCKDRKDYTGGGNHIVYWNQFLAGGLDGLVDSIKLYCKPHSPT